ncbi:hypothetical protein M569_02165 [Genlisea aurea]|uniref:Uncharacterized protein n=1 Tax=Genlisea aurea TaxID=192259 RepID=S8EIZ8_9LAMI|nr:hypothetical protein M569_02165 [Genlisea aurea]
MVGVASLLELLRKNPNFGSQCFSSRGLFTSKVVGFSASFAIASPFAFADLFRNGIVQVGYCDAGEAFGEDYSSIMQSASAALFRNDLLKHSAKQYDIQLKPLFSALHWRALSVTTIRSFLLFYLPLLEPPSHLEDEDADFLQDESEEERRLDLVAPFKKSVVQVVRETSVVTTRRVLERVAVHYVSQRMAWKLLKDVPKSAMRKAGRGWPISRYVFRVSRTTFRGFFLGALASWIIQLGVEVYRIFNSTTKRGETEDGRILPDQLHLVGKKVYSATVRCSSSLVFASIGAGIGATLFRPSTGQWIGCSAGDFAGPLIVAFVFEKLNLEPL